MLSYPINSPDVNEKFKKMGCYKKILNFLHDLTNNILQTDDYYGAYLKRNDINLFLNKFELFKLLYNELKVIDKISDTIIVDNIDQRYGSVSFRMIKEKYTEKIEVYSKEAVFVDFDCDENFMFNFKPVLQQYLLASLGSFERLDYGTGHELIFLVLLLIIKDLSKIHISQNYNFSSYLIFGLFDRYIELTIKLQKKFKLEPAGSKGDWGIDDYHFLPFLFGTFEMKKLNCNASYIDPNESKNYQKEFYMHKNTTQLHQSTCVSFQKAWKLLYNLFDIINSDKVCIGYIKMFENEILAKYTVNKLLPFCNYFKFE